MNDYGFVDDYKDESKGLVFVKDTSVKIARLRETGLCTIELSKTRSTTVVKNKGNFTTYAVAELLRQGYQLIGTL